MSYISLVLSEMFLPERNPVCDLDTILSMYGFILFAITVEASLYVTHNKEIGLQFFKKRLSLVFLGRHIIMAWRML